MNRLKSFISRLHLAGRCAVIAFVLGAAACSSQRSAQQTEMGDTYLRLGDTENAAEAYAKALEYDALNAQAQLGLARCLALQDNFDTAFAAYVGVDDIEATAIPAAFEAVDLLLAEDRPDDAMDWVDRLAETDREGSVLVRSYLLIRLGSISEAAQHLQVAYDEAVTRTPTIELALLWAYLRDGNADAANEVMEAILAQSPPNPALRPMIQAALKDVELPTDYRLFRLNDFGITLDRATTQSSEAGEDVLDSALKDVEQALLALQGGAHTEAARLFRLASFASPEHLFVHDLLANAEGRYGNLMEPVSVATAPQTENREDVEVLWNSAQLLMLVNRRNEWLEIEDGRAVNEAIALAALFSGEHSIAKEYASSLPADSFVRECIEAVFAPNDSDYAANLMGVIQEWPNADGPDAIGKRNAAGFAFASVGLLARALKTFLDCAEMAPQNDVALYNMAMMYRHMPAFEAEAWKRLIVRHPTHQEARDRLRSCYLRLGAYREAKTLAESTFIAFPDAPWAFRNLAEASWLAGDSGLALETLQKGLELSPDDQEMPLALATARFRLGDIDGALEVLEPSTETSQANGLRAFCHAVNGQWDETASALEGISASEVNDGLRMLSASALVRLDKHGEALAVLNANRDPSLEFPPHAAIVRMALGDGTSANAENTSLADALAQDSGSLAQFTFGSALRMAGHAGHAYQTLRTLDPALQSNPTTLALLFDALAAAPEIADRGELATGLAAQHANSPEAALGLADVFKSMEDEDGQRAALEQAQAVAGDSKAAWLRIATLAAQIEDHKAILASYEKLIALSPSDPLVQTFVSNNAAYVMMAGGGDLNRAATIAEGVFRREPSGSALHTLGLARLRQGRLDEGRELLYQALEQRPGDPTLLLDFGQALMQTGEPEEGMNLVRTAVAYADRLGVPFSRRAEAVAVLSAQ